MVRTHDQIMLEEIDKKNDALGLPRETVDPAYSTLFRVITVCDELKALREENAKLKSENELLRKAAGFQPDK